MNGAQVYWAIDWFILPVYSFTGYHGRVAC